MAAIGYSVPISALPTNELLIGEKRMLVNLQINISKAEGLVRVYTDKW